VVKHDAHGFRIDTPGKDSDRFFQAGADVALRGPDETVLRLHGATGGAGLRPILRLMTTTHDLVLVEGHKDTPLAKLWLEHPDRTPMPESVDQVLATLPWQKNRLELFRILLHTWIDEVWQARKLMIAVLKGDDAGGSDEGDGEPKRRALLREASLLTDAGNRDETLILEFPAGFEARPGEELLRVVRTRADATWLIAGTDVHEEDDQVMRALFSARRPGRWILYTSNGEEPRIRPVLLEPQALPLLEEAGGDLHPLLEHPKAFRVDS